MSLFDAAQRAERLTGNRVNADLRLSTNTALSVT